MSVGTRDLDDRVTVLEGAGPGGAASALATTGADVDVGSAAPPTTGKVLTATSATTATWQTPAAAAVSISQTEIDFGATSVDGATFIVADAAILAGSKIIGGVAYAAPTSKDISELDGEGLDLKFGVHSVGNLWIRARGQQPGQLCYGKWKINYLVG